MTESIAQPEAFPKNICIFVIIVVSSISLSLIIISAFEF